MSRHGPGSCAAALLLVAVLPGCSAPPAGPVPCRLSQVDRSLQLQVGAVCELRLAANPSTGYGWRLLPAEPTGLVQVDAPRHEPAPAAAAQVGVGGQDRFRLQALQPGRVTLRWIYQRPWLPDDAQPADRYELQLTLRP